MPSSAADSGLKSFGPTLGSLKCQSNNLRVMEIQKLLHEVLGLDRQPAELQFGQMLLRGFVVCVVTLAMMRLAGRRFLAQKSPFDVMLAFITASMMSRAINGSAAFFGTLGTGLVIAAAYRALAYGACKSHALGRLLKGESEPLVENGRTIKRAMARHQISHNDLLEDLRLNAGLENIEQVKLAHIERNGEVSVQRKPQVFDIGVEKGVQTVRVQIQS